MDRRIVVFATAWGPRFGGINAFNADLCAGLRQVVDDETEIVCVLIGPSAAEGTTFADWTREAAGVGVALRFLACPSEKTEPTTELLKELKSKDIAASLYVGHDLFTGPWAVALGKELERPSMVICHTAPALYKALQGVYGDDIWPTEEKQAELFRAARYVGGVGPRLYEYASAQFPEQAKGNVVQLIPGLAQIESMTPSPSSFLGITVGRINVENDVIKQGRLAAAAFGLAMRQLHDDSFSDDVVFRAIGLSVEDEAYRNESDDLARILKEHAGWSIPFVGNRFNESRESLFAVIGRQSVFYMLSRHEGFGLAGLEAIAAGVPLVISIRSGLYDFLKKHQLAEYVVDVTAEDNGNEGSSSALEQVAEKTKRIFNERTKARANAHALKKKLEDLGTTWRNCAEQLLRGCDQAGLLRQGGHAGETNAASLIPPKAWPYTGFSNEEETSARQILGWLITRSEQFAQLDGPLTDRKLRVLSRMTDIVRWDLNELYRYRVERISEGPTLGALERLSQLSSLPAGGDTLLAQDRLLLVVDPPYDAPPPFWAALVERARATDAMVLLTATDGALSVLPPDTRYIEWPAELALSPSDVGFRFGFGPSAADDPVEVEAVRLVSSTAFGLTEDGLFELLSDQSEEDRYEFISRLNEGEVEGLVKVEGRWVSADGTSAEPDEQLARSIMTFFQPQLNAAVGASRTGRWRALRAALPSALEGIFQRSRAGEPDLAYTQFRADLFEPALYRYARFDLVLKVLESFFVGADFSICRLSDPVLMQRARLDAAQALANLGRVNEAVSICTEVELAANKDGSTTGWRVLGAFCRFLAGDYEETEHMLRAALNDSSEPSDGFAVVHRSLAKLYLRELRIDLASTELKLAQERYSAANDEQGLAGVDAYLAELAIVQGEPDTALTHVSTGLERLARLEHNRAPRSDARDRLRLLLARGKALAFALRMTEAKQAADDAMATAVKTGALDLMIEAHVLLANVRQSSTMDETQRDLLGSIAALAEKGGLRRHHAEALLALATLESKCGHDGSWRERAQRALDIAELDGGVYQDMRLRQEANVLLALPFGDAI